VATRDIVFSISKAFRTTKGRLVSDVVGRALLRTGFRSFLDIHPNLRSGRSICPRVLAQRADIHVDRDRTVVPFLVAIQRRVASDY